MPELSVARRYAQALFDTAQKAGTVETIARDLETVDAAIQATPVFMRVLRAPTIARERKREVLGQIFAQGIDPLTTRFLDLLVERRREAVLPQMNREFKRLSNQFRKILPVTVRVATAMTPEERESLTRALTARTGQNIELNEEVDTSLMGGAVLRLGDTVIDGSVSGYLRRLRQQMISAAG